MKDLIRLTDYTKEDINEIFQIADELQQGKHVDYLHGKSVVLFFPNTSIRTRVTYEKGIYLLGGQPILFPTETLDKKEDLKDVCGYLSQWADTIIVRHRDIKRVERIATYSSVPVINAMTDINHPCEILSDLYSLSKIRKDFTKDHYLFCGEKGNIGLAWKEASSVFGFSLTQYCIRGYEMSGVDIIYDLKKAVAGKDIICTDSLPKDVLTDFSECQITTEIMNLANKGAVLNPCPPFYRGEEVSEDVINSDYFVGYDFKKNLLVVQQAIMIYLMEKSR